MSGGKKGQLTSIQPRIRLDLPPGGFLRPDGRPAIGSSAAETSSGTASGSAALLSVHRQGTRQHITLVYINKGRTIACLF